MKLRSMETAKSPAKLKKQFDLFVAARDRVRAIFIAPRPARRAKPNVYYCCHSLAGLQGLEARLMLTGPTAVNDSYVGSMYGTLSIPAYAGVLENDYGGSGPLSAELVSAPSAGSLSLNSDGSFTYTNSMYAYGDSFTYKDFDGTSYSGDATVNISLPMSGGSQPTIAAQDNYTVVHDRTLNVSAADGVLEGASDPNHLHLTAVLISAPSSGSLTLNSDGSFNFTPATHYVGSVSFGVEAYDGSHYSSEVTDSINVTDEPPDAIDDSYAVTTTSLTTTAATGVLANDTDPDGDTLTTSLLTGPAHGTLSLNSDGGFTYTPTPGWVGYDSFGYQASDGVMTADASVSLHTEYAVISAVDQTKVPVDTIHVSQQILSDPEADQAITSPLPAGGSGGTTISAAPADGAPATPHNLSLVYDSVLAQPDEVIEAEIGLSTANAMDETLEATLTFNGVAQAPVYFNLDTLPGTSPYIHLAQQVSTASLASGRYPWSMTVTSSNMASPVTISGAVNVVNDSSSPFGQGWDMPGLFRLFNNSVSGVPSGVLLSAGDATSYYYTQNEDGSYTSPAGPYAFSTLTSLPGGGWQLLTHEGVTFTFNSSGNLLSRQERTGETTSYGWTGNDLTSIKDQFGRTVALAYNNTGGLLSSITDYAGSVWNFSDNSSSELTSLSEPNVGNGSPVWQYAYSGGYMTSESDPNSNQTSFSLDNFHRLSGTTLPGNATTSDTSEQDFGYGSTRSSSPANLTLETSVSPTTTDPNQNTSGYQTDVFGNIVSETDVYGNTETIQRDPNGLPTVITLPPPATGDASPVTDISYDSTGDETSATGAQPTYGTFTYTADSFGQWATFTDITGKEWVRTFDSKGDILTETTPSGMQASWTYDSYGRPLTMTLPAPNDGSDAVTTQYVYDADERLVKIIWPDNSTQLFAYNSDDRQVSFTDEDSHTSGTALNALGWVTSTTNAANGVTAYTYDMDGNVLTSTSPLLNVTSYQWNSRNELVQETLPPPATGDANPVLSWTYDANGNELTSVSAMNLTTTYTYDKLNRIVTETLPPPAQGQSEPTTTFSYDNLLRKISEANALSGTTTWAYANTDISQLTSETLPAPSGSGQGPTTTYGFDSDGRQNTVTDSMNHTTTTTFTVDGQTASVLDNLGHGDTYGYGHGGELLTTTDSLNHSTSDQYDSRYRLVQTTDANNAVTQIALDPAGNETKLVDSDNNATSWTYNAVNLPLTETNSLGTTTTTYNADEMVASIEDADGRVRDFSYDNLDRLTAEQWMSGSTVVATMSYAYNLDNELTSASDPNSAYAFSYDGDGNVLSTDNSGTPNVPDVVLTNTYDALGDRTSQSASIAGTLDYLNSYTYDADQQLTVLQQQDQNGGDVISPKEVDFAYNALGQFTSIVDFNTLTGPRTDVATGTYSYDGANRLTGLAFTSNAGASTIDTLGWGYDAANNVASFTSNNGTAAYGYDPTNQLTSASYTTASGGRQPANEIYSFDANGNRNSTGYTTTSPNLMSSDGTYDYQYDADGNTTSRTQIASTYSNQYLTTYTWDYRNRLTDVEYYDNNNVLTEHVHFVYDVFDHLIATEVDTTGDGTYNQIDRWVLAVSPEIPQAGVPGTALAQPVFEFNGSRDLAIRYLQAVDRIFGEEAVSSLTQGGTNSWDLVNNLGSVVYVLDNTGAVIDQLVYNGFGVVAYESNPSVDHFAGFASGHVDANTGLVNNYHRWYAPRIGRWLSDDPLGLSGVDANPARYVANRASALTDSRGLAPDDEIAAMQMEDVYWNTVYEFWSVSNAIVSKQMEIKSLKGAFQIYMKQAKVDASTRLKIDAEMKNYESAFDYQALLSVETSMQKLVDAISKTQKQAKENMQTAQKKITQAYNVNIQLRKKQLELYDQMVALEWYMNKSAK